ncbi:MAG: MFS transporter [Gammaproteobacteria bacterium]|nr:MFS transporter [Gammaproteobacteria bacterium]
MQSTTRFGLPPNDLLRDRTYRRLWISILISSFGGQLTLLAVPLTAAVRLHATPTEMAWLTATEISAFVLLSLPAGVWLDRVRKLPVYIAGESLLALAVASVPVAWWLGWLSMEWLYVVGFAIGAVHTLAGSAAQIVLTQIVPRERLVEAHAKNALANSTAEVAGPGAAGVLISLSSAPVALLANAVLLTISAVILRGLDIREVVDSSAQRFVEALRAGLGFVMQNRLLVTMACVVGGWQFCHNAALVVQILFATRELGLSAGAVGLCYIGLGLGTVIASTVGNRIASHLGPGPTLVLGIAICSGGWLLGAMAPASGLGILMFALMLAAFGTGATLVFITFLALRQAATPAPMLGRMTSTMRWLILLPAGPGALLGGWLGEHAGLRYALAFAGFMALLISIVAWRQSIVRNMRTLPMASGPHRAADAQLVPDTQPGEFVP